VLSGLVQRIHEGARVFNFGAPEDLAPLEAALGASPA
jgi:hypothetical protein